ncbi:MAG: hypothetical protein HY676_03300 [Chloroflexi bacterium]|nr:hypothetical protein [Chloroflexota bacterium]
MRTKEGIKASSATYRKATNEVVKQLKIGFEHTKYPSDDFQAVSEIIPEKLKEKALKWYKIGIKRGFNKATSMMLEGKFHLEESTLYGPRQIEVKVRTRFDGERWISRKIKIDADEIGFE